MSCAPDPCGVSKSILWNYVRYEQASKQVSFSRDQNVTKSIRSIGASDFGLIFSMADVLLTPRGEKVYLDRVSARAQLSEWAPQSPRYTPRRQAELCYTPRRKAERFSGLPDEECSICLEPFELRVDTRCNHSFCAKCVGTLLTTPRGTRHTPCPKCRAPFLLSELKVHSTGEAVAPLLLRQQLAICGTVEEAKSLLSVQPSPSPWRGTD